MHFEDLDQIDDQNLQKATLIGIGGIVENKADKHIIICVFVSFCFIFNFRNNHVHLCKFFINNG